MASHPDDLDVMLAAQKASGKVAAVQMQHMGRSSMLQLREAIRRGAIGRIREVFLSSLWWRNEDYYERTAWAGRMKIEGKWCIDGALFNQCVHYVAQMLTLASPGEGAGGAESVPPLAQARKLRSALYRFHRAPTLETGDTAFAVGMLDTPDAPRLTLVGTTCSTQERHQVELLGTKGRALWNGAGYLFVDGQPVEEFQDDRGEFDGQSRVFTSWARAIRGRGRALTEFEIVQNATRFLYQLYEACGWRIHDAPWEAIATLFTDVIERVRAERCLPANLSPRPSWA